MQATLDSQTHLAPSTLESEFEGPFALSIVFRGLCDRLSESSREHLRLLLLVASAALVACAGSLADAAPGELSFARTEITRSENLLSDLVERVSNESDLGNVARMGKALKNLDRRIIEAQKFLEQATRETQNPYVAESLRASVMILEEASTRALNSAIDADQRNANPDANPEHFVPASSQKLTSSK